LRYLLDSNTYIQAKNQYYDMDVCVGYWEWLEIMFQAGEVCSIEFIGKELRDGNDELADWAKKQHHAGYFAKHDDEATQAVFVDIVNFVMEKDYNPADRDKFLSKGDPWLIAKAKTTGATIVTHEATLVPATRKVKIPNLCVEFDVPCINTFDMLRQLKARFMLDKQS
tara:strand:- start:43 stop:546 length:504 start_codon:yes stop_codon:yes gene_type:complete